MFAQPLRTPLLSSQHPTSLLHLGLSEPSRGTREPGEQEVSADTMQGVHWLIVCIVLVLGSAIWLLQPSGALLQMIEGFAARGIPAVDFSSLRGSAGLADSHSALAAAVFADPPALLKSGLLVLHVFGLVIGLGPAILIDLYFTRFLYRHQANSEAIRLLEIGSRLVGLGILLLWISGAGFLLHYWWFDPSKLANPKIWAKVSIVILLTANGIYIHTVLKPALTKARECPLLRGATPLRAMQFLVPAVVSFSAWVFAACLGLIRELNFAISSDRLIWAYIAALSAMLAAATLIHSMKRASQVGRFSV